ncbi:MAG: hypothetical protein ACREGJ_03865 [Candidatus Saccharimonadales bacterium]
MFEKTALLNKLREKPLLVYSLVFVAFLLLHIVIFRDVIAAIPAILSGDAVVVREELVPFFSFTSQFFSEGTSALTSSDEVRVAYSFWTAWVRHVAILPFALVLLNAFSLFLLFYAFHRIGRYFTRDSLFGVLAAALSALLIFTILLYAKIAHFYVLIIGFSMFALAVTLMCEQLFFKKNIEKRNVLAVSLLVLFNPAIHYHVIFYLTFVLVLVAYMVFTLFMNRSYFWFYLKKNLIYFLVVTAVSFIPYSLLIFFATQTDLSSVSTQIPVNYWMIFYASLSTPFIFSLDTAGHLDLIRYGDYLAPIPRIGTLVATFLVGSVFLFKQWADLHMVKKVLLVTLFFLLIVAMWMSLGYTPNSPFSFHSFLGNLALFFAEQGSALSNILSQLIALFINILRFPHRFQFIYFYVAGVLLTIVLVWLRDALSRKMGKRIMATAMVVLLAIFPIVGSGDYRSAMFSGDVASFVAPYAIPDDLKRIKQELAGSQGNKVFIMPTLESGREIVKSGERYSFLDKFLIYYLNQPTYYYGVGANTNNKIIAYLVYRAIAFNEPWWEDILVNNLGITHVLMPKKLESRRVGITYLPGVEDRVTEQLKRSTKFKPVHEGDEYALYAAQQPASKDSHVLVDMELNAMTKYLEERPYADSTLYFPLQLDRLVAKPQTVQLATDSVERSFYDVYTAQHRKQVFYPNPATLAFTAELVASSNFTNNALSLSTLYNKNDDYNYLHENVPSLVNLQTPQFIGLTKGDKKMDLTLNVPRDGTYRVLLHGASNEDELSALMGGHRIRMQKIEDDRNADNDYLDFTYFVADIELVAGAQTLAIENTRQNAVLVESATLLSKDEVPQTFDSIERPEVDIKPTAQPQLFELVIKGGNS